MKVHNPSLAHKPLILTLLITLSLLVTTALTSPVPNFNLNSAPLDPTKTGFTLLGGVLNSMLGGSVSTAGDIDKDGYSDIIIGASYYSTNKGAAYVLYGGPESSFSDLTLFSTLNPATTGFIITGNDINNFFGGSVSTAGDINNDGYSDIIIGAWNKENQGAAYVIYGGPRSSLQNIDLSTTTLNPLISGFMMTANAQGDSFGYSVSTAGDVNGDNYDDIIVGAYNRGAGAAYVIYGGPKSSLPNLDFYWVTLDPLSNGFIVEGNAQGDHFGSPVSTAGDVNNDGYSDIIIGAIGKDNGRGAAYVVYGGPKTSLTNIDLSQTTLIPSSTGFMISGNVANDYFGFSLSTAGDVNNDNYDDMIIGAAQKNSNQGAAYLIYGGPNTSNQNIDLSASILNPSSTGFTMTGGTSNEYLGAAVSTAGDVNKDGYADIIIGGRGRNTYQGIVYVVYGGLKSSLQNIAFNSMTLDPATTGFTILGNAQQDYFAVSVSTAGDVNNDGYDDIIVGAFRKNSGKGAAYVVHSTCPVTKCKSCLSRVCQACDTKFYLTSSKECASCPSLCDTCSDSSTCTKCTTPYSLYHSQCVSSCPAKTLLSNGECLDCPINCDQCSTTSTCSQCTSPYLLYQSQCISSSSCTAARFISGGNCLDCSLHCSSCTSLASCQACDTKYYLTSSAQCSICPNNCDQCSDSSTCTTCSASYFLYQSQCVSSCPAATFPSNGQCINCPQDCASCTSSTSCQTCNSGFVISSSLCAACPNNCDQCSTTSTCSQCSGPYLLYQSQCISSSSCTGPRFISNGRCFDCSSHCSSCTSLASCQTCETQYYLTSSAQCSICPNNCDQCSDSSICTKCSSPYFLYQSQCFLTCPDATFPSSSTGECQDCPIHCSQCTSEKSCQTCEPGYFITDSSLCDLPSISPLPPALKTQAKVSHAVSSSATGLGSVLCYGSSTFPVNILINKAVQNTRYMNLTVSDKLAEAYKTWGTQMIPWDFPEVFSHSENFNPQPSVFSRYDLDSPFLVNFWSSLMTIAIGIGTLLVCSLLKRLLLKRSAWIYSSLEKVTVGSINFTIAQAYGCLDDILFYAVLDLRSNPFDSFFAWASFFAALAFIVIGISHVLFNVIMVKRYQKVKKNGNSLSDLETFNIKNKYWELFYSDFSDADSWSQCFLALLIVRNSVSSLIIATLYDLGITQTIFLLMMDGAIIIFLLSKKPLLTVRAAVAQYFFEIIALLVHLCMFILCFQDNNTTLQNIVCTLIIYLNIILVAGGTLFMLFEIYLNVREIFTAWKARRNKKTAVSPITLETSDAQNILTTTQPALTEQNLTMRDNQKSTEFYLPSGFNRNQKNERADSERRNLQPFQNKTMQAIGFLSKMIRVYDP